MYEAKIIEKDTRHGVLHSTVQFTSEKDQFTEIFTSPNPTKEWIDTSINDTLKRINKVQSFDVAAMSEHPVLETLETDFEVKKAEEKAKAEKEKEEASKPKEVTPVEPIAEPVKE